MVALLVSAFGLAQAVSNAAPVQKIVGFECADRDNKSSRRRVNIDLSDHVWQAEDGNWYKIAAEAANSLSLRNVTSGNGSRERIDLDRFKLELSEVQYIAPANMFLSRTYVCRMGSPIDMTVGRKF